MPGSWCASLDASNTWRASLPLRCGKIDEMSLIPNNPKPFVRGLVSIAGVDTTPTSPAMHRTSPLLNTMPAGTTPLLCTERASRARQNLPTRKKTKKNARHAKKHDGRSFTHRRSKSQVMTQLKALRPKRRSATHHREPKQKRQKPRNKSRL